jgi:hypothetical protein
LQWTDHVSISSSLDTSGKRPLCHRAADELNEPFATIVYLGRKQANTQPLWPTYPRTESNLGREEGDIPEDAAFDRPSCSCSNRPWLDRVQVRAMWWS